MLSILTWWFPSSGDHSPIGIYLLNWLICRMTMTIESKLKKYLDSITKRPDRICHAVCGGKFKSLEWARGPFPSPVLEKEDSLPRIYLLCILLHKERTSLLGIQYNLSSDKAQIFQIFSLKPLVNFLSYLKTSGDTNINYDITITNSQS